MTSPLLPMISPKLYKSSRTYDFFMKSLGYERSIERFLHGLNLECQEDCRILDAGCGTGVLGLHFLQRFPRAQLHVTDLEPNFLKATLANADRRGLETQQITAGIADISEPGQLTTLEGDPLTLDGVAFDLICVGAVVGYARDTEASLRRLVGLLAPGGYLLNLEMNESLAGRFVSRRYHYENIALARMKDVIREEGCQVAAESFKVRHLPAKLTRTAVIARKEASV